MDYSAEEFAGLDEVHALADVLEPLGPCMHTVLNEARSGLETWYRSELFWVGQNQQNLSRMTNQRAAVLWESREETSWRLSDRSGFLHLREENTGVRLILRKVDPVTRQLPKANATKANQAYYTQGACRGVGKLVQQKQTDLFTAGRCVPDLSDIRLVCAWEETEQGLALTVYKPATPGSYGGRNRYWFRFPLPESAAGDEQYVFIPTEDDQENLIPDLLNDGTGDEAETGESSAEQRSEVNRESEDKNRPAES